MVESYLHRMAKELLYTEIEKNNGFEWKTEKESGFESLITRDDYRGECVLMEFPTKEGMYPDESGCSYQHAWACNPSRNKFRFHNGNGYCKCSNCEFYDFKNAIVHDIAAFWKGNVRFAIEIINKHEPKWDICYASMPYKIYFVRAEDVLKRVDSTPVFVYDSIRTSDVIYDNR